MGRNIFLCYYVAFWLAATCMQQMCTYTHCYHINKDFMGKRRSFFLLNIHFDTRQIKKCYFVYFVYFVLLSMHPSNHSQCICNACAGLMVMCVLLTLTFVLLNLIGTRTENPNNTKHK